MPLKDTIESLDEILNSLSGDLKKVNRGNRAAAQRVRVGTVALARVAKKFRKESVAAEKRGKTKWKALFKSRARKKSFT